MKVLALLLIIGSVSCWKSGPYLPSGWKPEGPAFLLPMEVEISSPKAESVQESEASGSDYLREYGPPKEDVSQDITQQALPDVVTEQAFDVIRTNAKPEEIIESAFQERVEEEETDDKVEDEVTTETLELKITESITKEGTTSDQEVSIEAIVLPAVQVTNQSAVDIIQVEQSEAATQETSERVVEVLTETQIASEEIVKEVEKTVEELEAKTVAEVNNIAEAIASLEKEMKVQEVKSALELKTTDTGVPADLPEGFLEYGPPGFREYGPPKEELRTSVKAVIQEETSLNEISDSNETRRRRFSPKLKRSSKKIHH